MNFSFSARQMDTLAADKQRSWRLQVVAEWTAIYSAAYGMPERLTFDRACDIADHILDRLELYPEPSSGPVGYELVHAVLTEGERGASSQQLHAGLSAFLECLPSAEAGFILLEAHCAVG